MASEQTKTPTRKMEYRGAKDVDTATVNTEEVHINMGEPILRKRAAPVGDMGHPSLAPINARRSGSNASITRKADGTASI